MKFQRNARIFQGRLDVAPFAIVFFLLVIFVVLGSRVYTPGVRLQLPSATDLPGTDQLTVPVAVGPNGQFFFENQGIGERQLVARLREAVLGSPRPLTVLVQADKKVTYERLIHLTMLAREAGITNSFLATLPRPFEGPAGHSPP
jgi:biopolymer transport protein ExbD